MRAKKGAQFLLSLVISIAIFFMVGVGGSLIWVHVHAVRHGLTQLQSLDDIGLSAAFAFSIPAVIAALIVWRIQVRFWEYRNRRTSI